MSPKQGHSKNSRPPTKEHLLHPEPDLPAQFSGHLVFIHVSCGGRGGAEEADQREVGGWGAREVGSEASSVPVCSSFLPGFPKGLCSQAPGMKGQFWQRAQSFSIPAGGNSTALPSLMLGGHVRLTLTLSPGPRQFPPVFTSQPSHLAPGSRPPELRSSQSCLFPALRGQGLTLPGPPKVPAGPWEAVLTGEVQGAGCLSGSASPTKLCERKHQTFT